MMVAVPIKSSAPLRLSWTYRVDREGLRVGEAHLIEPDPAMRTLCGVVTDDRFWESIGVTLDGDLATGIAEPGCHACARAVAPVPAGTYG